MDEQSEIARRRMPRWRIIALGLILLITALLLALWTQRKDIAAGFIDRELARRGVQAHYEITHLGFGRQRLENVRIGDPRAPDLTARWVEIQLSYGFRAPRVSFITARGVRMFGRIVKGKLSLGQIDKLLPPPTGAPFRLPDLGVDLNDMAMRLDTPAGALAMAIRGRGNLSDGFRGRAAVLARRLRFGECILERPVASVQLTVSGRQPNIAGPVRTPRFACGNSLELASAQVDVDALLAQALDGWIGRAGLQSATVRSGANLLAAATGRLSFSGNAERTRGTLALAGEGARFGDSRSGPIGFDGAYDVAFKANRLALAGRARAAGVAIGPNNLRPAIDALASLAGTPLEPVGRALADALAGAGRSLDLGVGLRLVRLPGGMAVRINQLDATSRSGAHLVLAGSEGFTIDGTSGAMRLDGRFTLEGGGFPAVEAFLSQPRAGTPLSGTARISPYRVRNGRLALDTIRFTGLPDGSTRLETFAHIDGPLAGAQMTDLAVPVRGRFGNRGFQFGETCTPAAFQSLHYGSLTLAPTRLSLCPFNRALLWKGVAAGVHGGADIANLRLAGRLGSSALHLAAARLRFNLDQPGFTSRAVAVRLGSAGAVQRLDLAGLTGRFGSRGVAGGFSGGSGKLANIPLLMSKANGNWQVAGGKATIDSALTISDEIAPSRFYPLDSKDFRLTLVDNQIEARGALVDPEKGVHVGDVTIHHDLDRGRGRAEIDVPGITFSKDYQPEELTRLTTGVVALVEGAVRGRGEIVWTPEGTTSTGTFSTSGMNLAASFGPVSGLSTTINFTDLLNLQTAPDQLAEVQQVQAGIDVFDGQIRYQLLPDLHVKVESGRWPFAGGELILDETVLDFSKPTAKALTFRVVGMDAAAFVELMKFSNIDATGTFDGVIPMIFDEHGGRIVRGHLQARPGGGVVSYIGELSDKQIGAYGKLAFDALKSLRYSKLTVDLNGALDGEFVAGIELDGIARNAPNPGGITGHIFRELAKIPFEFNITARGPFRAIIATMRSMKDPSGLIQSVLPTELRDQPSSATVQPQESETVR